MQSTDPGTFRIIDLWSFRSTKSNKRYIVEIERFSANFVGLKFYWKGVAQSDKRYSYLTYDYEPRTIVMSCVMIMLDYLKSNRFLSFGFVAAEDCDYTCDKKPNKRFRFYRRLMLSLFGPKTFIQAYDINSSLYIMINRIAFESGDITLPELEEEISRLYIGDFALRLQ